MAVKRILFCQAIDRENRNYVSLYSGLAALYVIQNNLQFPMAKVFVTVSDCYIAFDHYTWIVSEKEAATSSGTTITPCLTCHHEWQRSLNKCCLM